MVLEIPWPQTEQHYSLRTGPSQFCSLVGADWWEQNNYNDVSHHHLNGNDNFASHRARMFRLLIISGTAWRVNL